MLGERITDLQAMLTTIVPERQDLVTGETRKVKVDDFACFHARFGSGAVGVFQTSRNAVGAGNQHELTLYGDEGTLHVSTLNDRQVFWTKHAQGESVTETIEAPIGDGAQSVAVLCGACAKRP